MGADLMLAMAELRETKEKTFARLERLTFTADDIERFTDCGTFDWHETEWDDETPTQMRERLRKAVNVVYGTMSRDTVDFTIDGERTFVVTGGVSWGDEPSTEYDDFLLYNEFLGYPYWLDKTNPKRIDWEKEAE